MGADKLCSAFCEFHVEGGVLSCELLKALLRGIEFAPAERVERRITRLIVLVKRLKLEEHPLRAPPAIIERLSECGIVEMTIRGDLRMIIRCRHYLEGI